MRLLMLGYGYSATALATMARGRFAATDGTVRTPAKATALAGGEVRLHVHAGGAPSAALAGVIAQADVVVVSAAPDVQGDPFLRHLGPALAASPALALVQYLSTVGVYGDHGGGWVDEQTPPRPVSARSRMRLAAEQAWQDFAARSGKPVQIHRLAGIYGPGRNALADLAEGTARRLDKPGQVFNRIHVEDIARVLLAGVGRPEGGIFNVCDDEPAPASEVVAFAASLLGVEPPPLQPFATAELSPMARSFYGENKRCANRAIRQRLGVDLAYPTYREGLRALAAAGEGRGA